MKSAKKSTIKLKLWFCDTVYIFAMAMLGNLSNKLSDKVLKWYIDKVVVLEIKAEFPGVSTETSRFIGYYFNKLRKFPGIRRARMDPNQKKILNPSIAGGWKERDWNDGAIY